MDDDRTCMAIAASQSNLITYSQASAHLSRHAIARRVEAGLWRKVLPEVYAIGLLALTTQERVSAAALWVRRAESTRERSCISHTTAGWLLGVGTKPEPIHVCSPRALPSPASWIVVHRVDLEPHEITSIRRIPATTPRRTLLDLGAVVSAEEVESALETALRNGTVSLERLERYVTERAVRGRRGAAVLRMLLDDCRKDHIPTESELELRFFRIVRSARLPLPVRQRVIVDQGRFIARVDFAYPDRDLVIEVHGWAHHGARKRWHHDLWRGNHVTLSGARTLVFTWRDVTQRPAEVRSTLCEALRRFPGRQHTLAL